MTSKVDKVFFFIGRVITFLLGIVILTWCYKVFFEIKSVIDIIVIVVFIAIGILFIISAIKPYKDITDTVGSEVFNIVLELPMRIVVKSIKAIIDFLSSF